MNWFRRWIGGGRKAAEGQADLPPSAGFNPPQELRYPKPEAGLRIVATGDIHGRIDLLRDHLPKLDSLAADASKRMIEIYLGDYIDRTGDSREVIELLLRRKASARHEIIFLMGNHEEMMLEGLKSDEAFKSWILSGGHSTLRDYGISPAGVQADARAKRERLIEAVHGEHRVFLEGLKFSHRCGGYFFVHAGVRPGVALEKQIPDDLLWIRNEFLNSQADHGAIVVHGHTPSPQPQYRRNRIGIDTGAYYTGNLMSLVIDAEATSAIVTTAPTFEPD